MPNYAIENKRTGAGCIVLFTKEQLKKLIIPLMLEQLLVVSVGLVDTLMVSQSGDAAISGVALVDNINRLIIQIMAALATGGTVVCSQYLGRRDYHNASKASAQLHMVMLVFALSMTALAVFLTRPVLDAIFGQVTQEVMDCAVLYFVVTSFSYPFLAVYSAGAAIFRSQGNSKISMQISLLMNAVNVGANTVFVFGFHWSVFGVAMATVLSYACAGLIMLCCMYGRKHDLRSRSVRDFLPNGRLIRSIMVIGIPSGIENGMFQIGKLLVASMVSTFGTASIAANAIGYTVTDFFNIPALSMGLALITIVGQCVGAGEKEQAKQYTKQIMKYSYYCDWACKLLLFVLAGWICQGFHLSPQAYDIAVQILHWFCIVALPIWPLSFTLPNAMRASGDIRYTMLSSLLSMWVFRVGGSYLLGVLLGLGVLGIWFGMFVDWAARALLFSVRFRSGVWLKHGALMDE